MIDLAREQLLNLGAACALVPAARSGRKTHLSTLVRWITAGARGVTGGVVRLEALRVGGRWATSREALQRFFERLTPRADADGPPALGPRTPAKQQRASERAAAELDRIGI